MTFTSSLLTRSSKLSELIGQLEMELGEKKPESQDGKRVSKPQTQTCITMHHAVCECMAMFKYIGLNYNSLVHPNSNHQTTQLAIAQVGAVA